MANAPAPAPPARGMRRIPFALQSYQHPSAPLSSQRLLNLFAEQEPADARVAAALIPTAGLTWAATFGTGPIWAMNGDLPGRIYIASGSNFYRQIFDVGGAAVNDLGSIGTPEIGTVPNSALMVTIAVGPTAAVVCVPPKAYTCDHFGALNEITDPDFPGAASVTYLDGYFVFSGYGNNAQFFISRLLDPSAFDALDFAFSDALPNVIRRVVAHRGDVWLLGSSGIEIWYDSGDADFPFRRQSGGVIPVGVATPRSVARGDDSVFWVGADAIVYQSAGYRAKRISDHAVEAFLQSSYPSEVTQGQTHVEQGHVFYSFTLGARTLVYDCATQVWADRSSSADGSGPWLVSSVVTLATGKFWLGDQANGNVYTLSSAGTENGVTVPRQAILPPLWAGTSRAFCARLEIEMEVGAGVAAGDVLLSWSDDGGISWSGARTLQSGLAGQTRKRVFTTRLGSFRQRVFRLSMQGRATLYAVDADIETGGT